MRRAFSGAVCIAAIAQIAGAAEPSRTAGRVLTLHPTLGCELRIDLNYDFHRAQTPFKKEPALEGKLIARGWIPTVPPTPMIRNITEGQLYVQPDHDPDFTAGSPTTYSSECRDGVHVSFEGMHVFSQPGSLAIPYTVDLRTYQRGLGGWLIVRSGWTAQFESAGGCWTFTVIDNLDGRIDGQDRLILRQAGPDAGLTTRHECPVPRSLFLDGQAFDLDFTYRQIETGIVLEAALTELQLPMGELRIDANGCRSLALRDDRQVVLLSDPGGAVPVPVGRYQVDNCVLAREPNQWSGPVFSSSDQDVCVEPGQAASFHIGLPLTNSIEVTRDRNLLSFKYRLVGAGGESYDYDNPAVPPAFRIYKGPVRIGSGSFGFG